MSDDYSRGSLRADCAGCAGLCCVAPAFDVSADFPIHKPAGEACVNLTSEYRCRIHRRLLPEGFRGCVAFDCFGAGQRTTRAFGGRTWQTDPTVAGPMFEVFASFRLLHEILWYLEEAYDRIPDGTLRAEVSELRQRTQDAAEAPPGDGMGLDATKLQRQAGVVLEHVSRVLRRGSPAGASKRRADLAGQQLRDADLVRADLRAASLIGADLRRADLRRADLLGADLRGADLRGANLVDAIFLTQGQIQAAAGDAGTVLPPALVRPSHW